MTDKVLDTEQLGGLAEAAGVDAVRAILEAFWASTDELTAELTASVDQNDTEQMAKTGHALKGSSANLGAALLAERAKEIEDAARNGNIHAARDLLRGFAADIASTRTAMDELLQRYG